MNHLVILPYEPLRKMARLLLHKDFCEKEEPFYGGGVDGLFLENDLRQGVIIYAANYCSFGVWHEPAAQPFPSSESKVFLPAFLPDVCDLFSRKAELSGPADFVTIDPESQELCLYTPTGFAKDKIMRAVIEETGWLQAVREILSEKVQPQKSVLLVSEDMQKNHFFPLFRDWRPFYDRAQKNGKNNKKYCVNPSVKAPFQFFAGSEALDVKQDKEIFFIRCPSCPNFLGVAAGYPAP